MHKDFTGNYFSNGQYSPFRPLCLACKKRWLCSQHNPNSQSSLAKQVHCVSNSSTWFTIKSCWTLTITFNAKCLILSIRDQEKALSLSIARLAI